MLSFTQLLILAYFQFFYKFTANRIGIYINTKWNVGKYERIFQKLFLNVAFSIF